MAALWGLIRVWGPPILRNLPAIISVAQGAYAIFRQINEERKNKKEADCVKISMAMLNKHQDDIDRLLEDPEQKRQLLEGLSILMNRITTHEATAHTAQRDYGFKKPGGSSFPEANEESDYHYPAPPPPYSVHYDDPFYPTKPSNSSSSSSASYCGGARNKGLHCDVCYAMYDASTRRPLLMPCGHTFCRPCLENVARNRGLSCPTCRKPSSTPISNLATNLSLLSVVESNAEKGNLGNHGFDGEHDGGNSKGGDKYGKGGKGTVGGDGPMSLSFEDQIEYAIWLSRREMERHRDDGVLSACWREVEEMDAELAFAMQESEILYESLLSSGKSQTDDSPLYYVEKEPDRKGCVVKERTQGCSISVPDSGACVAASPPDDESSLRLALELHEEEVRNAQWGPGCSDLTPEPNSWDEYKSLCMQGRQETKKGKNLVTEENLCCSGMNEDSERRMEENGSGKRKEEREESACCGWTSDNESTENDDERRLEENKARKEKELETVEERNEMERKEQMLLDWAIRLSLEQEDEEEARDDA